METTEELHLYSISHFRGRGVGINLIRRWFTEGIFTPYLYIGRTPKFREADFAAAAERVGRSQRETRLKTIERMQKNGK